MVILIYDTLYFLLIFTWKFWVKSEKYVFLSGHFRVFSGKKCIFSIKINPFKHLCSVLLVMNSIVKSDSSSHAKSFFYLSSVWANSTFIQCHNFLFFNEKESWSPLIDVDNQFILLKTWYSELITSHWHRANLFWIASNIVLFYSID